MLIFAKNNFMSKEFSQLGIIEPLIKSLSDSEISIPTDIQQKIIPLFLKEKHDLVGLAKTGTGKTAAFGLPLLQLIDLESLRSPAKLSSINIMMMRSFISSST